MFARFAQWTIDVRDVELMATFWSRALGYRVHVGDDGSAKLYPTGRGGARRAYGVAAGDGRG